ncbi:MAG: hypothetical protein JO323_11990 [Acidobacteriia bacterium]|nr:hypothetical protein [Terriglobia bacterium]
MGLILGGGFVLTGIAALIAEMSPAMVDQILRFWPAGLIGIGVALLLGSEKRNERPLEP